MRVKMRRIKAVRAAEARKALVVTWEDGSEDRVDLTAWINSSELLAPLCDPKVFRQVRVGEWGWDIVWPGNEDLALDAHHLKRLALEQAGEAMATQDFRAWRAAHKLTLDKAAQALGLSRRMVAYYENGRTIIPKYIRLACQAVGQKAPTPPR